MNRSIHPKSKPYQLAVYRTNEELDQIRPIWEKMQYHPNADIDYFLTINSLRENIIHPYVMMISQEDKPVCLLIGRIEKRRLDIKIGYAKLLAPKLKTLVFIYGGILGEVPSQLAEYIVDAILELLLNREADVACFNQLKSDSPLLSAAQKNPRMLFRDHIQRKNKHYLLGLPDSFEEFMKSRSANTRSNIRRTSKKLIKKYDPQLEIRTFTKEDELDEMMEAIDQVASKTYQRALGVGLASDPQGVRLAALALKKKWLRVYLLSIDGVPRAFWPGNLYQGTFHIGIPGYDPRYHADRLGYFLLVKAIEELCGFEDVKHMDFGFGDAQYKRSFATDAWDEETVFIFAPTIKGAVLNLYRTGASWLNTKLRSMMERLRLLEFIKRRWRSQMSHKN